jgi:hypothetical protein
MMAECCPADAGRDGHQGLGGDRHSSGHRIGCLAGSGLDRRIEAMTSIIVIRRFIGALLASPTSKRRAQATAARTRGAGSRARRFRARLRVRAQAWPRVQPAADVLALRQVRGADRGGGTAIWRSESIWASRRATPSRLHARIRATRRAPRGSDHNRQTEAAIGERHQATVGGIRHAYLVSGAHTSPGIYGHADESTGRPAVCAASRSCLS